MTVTKAVAEATDKLRASLLHLEDGLRKSGEWPVYEALFNAVRLDASELIEESAK